MLRVPRVSGFRVRRACKSGFPIGNLTKREARRTPVASPEATKEPAARNAIQSTHEIMKSTGEIELQ